MSSRGPLQAGETGAMTLLILFDLNIVFYPFVSSGSLFAFGNLVIAGG